VGKVRHFLGGEGTFDYAQGELFIDENFASIRGTYLLLSLQRSILSGRAHVHVSMRFRVQIQIMTAVAKTS
jgi:hypothetical protein